MNSYRTTIPRAAAHKRSQKDRGVTVITKSKKRKGEEKKMNDKELIKEINFIVGAVDGKTRERVKRLITYLHQYQWAYGELQLLIDLQNIDGTSQVSDTERRREEIRKKLHSGLHEADLSLGLKYE